MRRSALFFTARLPPGAGSSLAPISIGARLLFYSRNFEGSDRHRAWRIARPSGAAGRLGCWWWRRLRRSIAEAYGPNERRRASNRRRAPSVCSAAWARLESEHNFTVGQAQRLGNALRPTRGYSFASTAITRDVPSTFLREQWLAFATATPASSAVAAPASCEAHWCRPSLPAQRRKAARLFCTKGSCLAPLNGARSGFRF
ncbi:hypothetical protein ABH975_007290 [Bradyrhizobium ottawaense]